MQIDEVTPVSVIMKGKIGLGHQLVVGLPEYTMGEAQQIFTQYDIHHLPVVQSLDEPFLQGIVSATDLLRFYTTPRPQSPSEPRLGELMTKSPTTITKGTAIRDAVSTLAQAKFNSLPVVAHDGRLIGIVTTRDIVRYLNGQYGEDVYAHIQDIIAKATSNVTKENGSSEG